MACVGGLWIEAMKRVLWSQVQLSSLLQVSPAGMRSPDFLASRLSFPKQVLLRLVSSEASRLSKTNRLKAITLQEINAAVTLVRQRIHTRAAA